MLCSCFQLIRLRKVQTAPLFQEDDIELPCKSIFYLVNQKLRRRITCTFPATPRKYVRYSCCMPSFSLDIWDNWSNSICTFESWNQKRKNEHAWNIKTCTHIWYFLELEKCVYLYFFFWVSGIFCRSCWQICATWFCNGTWFLFLQPSKTCTWWGLCSSFSSSLIKQM